MSLRLSLLHTLICLTTLLALNACNDEGAVEALSVRGAFDPATLDFGDVPVGMSKTLSVSLNNTGIPVFEIESVSVPASFTLIGLKASLEGAQIAPGDSLELDVAFLAMNEGEATGELIITSGRTEVALQLRGRGAMVRVPVLSVEPISLDFGSVEVGTETRLSATIRNAGNAGARISQVTVESGSREFAIDGTPTFDVLEGASSGVVVVFSPSSEGVKNERMLFSAAGHDPVVLQVRGQGVVPGSGEVLCVPSSLDFGVVTRGDRVVRQVECSARGGAAQVTSVRLSSQQSPYFSVPNQVGTVDLAADDRVAIDVAYEPDGLPDRHSGELQVTYSGGAGSGTARVALSGEVVPPPTTETAISVVLRWNTNGTDVDLHLIEPNGEAFDQIGGSDCFFANDQPDWGVQNDPSDNPYLDVDDQDGLGPETINLSAARPGNYEIMIHYFADNFQGSSSATVDVHVGGMLVGTYNRALSCDDTWTVGTVDWDGMTGTFAPSNAVSSVNYGFCF